MWNAEEHFYKILRKFLEKLRKVSEIIVENFEKSGKFDKNYCREFWVKFRTVVKNLQEKLLRQVRISSRDFEKRICGTLKKKLWYLAKKFDRNSEKFWEAFKEFVRNMYMKFWEKSLKNLKRMLWNFFEIFRNNWRKIWKCIQTTMIKKFCVRL